MFKKLKKFFYLYILRKKYYRVGSCNACGRCCQKIYVKHKNVIQTEEEFKKLQKLHPFYTYLKIIDKDETGLVFECMNLDKETNKCKIHKTAVTGLSRLKVLKKFLKEYQKKARFKRAF